MWQPILSLEEQKKLGWTPILPKPIQSGISLTNQQFGMAQSTPQQSTLNINPVTIARDTAQAVARTVASVGITAGNLANKSKPFQDTIDTSWSPITRAVFGGQPINTIQQSIKNTEQKTSPYLGKSGSNLLAPTFVFGSIALDLSGFGGGKAVKIATGEIPELFFKTMAKETNPKVISSMLKGTGMTEAHIAELAPKFAKTTTAEEAKNVLLEFGKTAENTGKTVYQIGDKTFDTTKEAVAHQNELMLQNRDNFSAIANGTSKAVDTTIRGVEVPIDNGFGVGNPSDILGSRSAKTASKNFDTYFNAGREPIPQPLSIAEQIAKTNDSARIAGLLHTTGVDKEQIPQMAKMLVGIDNPKKVTNIIEGFDITRTPKAPVKLPPVLEQKQTAIEMKKQVLDQMQLQPLEKYVVKSGNMKGSLPELGVGKIKFATQGDKIIDNTVGHGRYAEDVRTQFEDVYMPLKQEMMKMEAELKQEIKNIKTEPSTPPQDIAPIQGEPGEVKSIEIQAKQALSIANGEEIPSGVSLPKIISQTVTPIKSRVNILDTYLRTPNRVMEKMGFGKEAKELRIAMDSYWKELPKNINKISQWSKEVSKESNQRIFKYLDGQAITLGSEEQRVANEIQTWLAEWADRLKLGKENRISEYITHIFDKDFTEGKSFPEEIAKIISDKIPGSVYDPFTLKRLGAKGYLEDTWKALDAYVKRGTRKVHLDPVLEKIQSKAGSSLELSNIEKSQWQYIKKYVDNINIRPSELDESIDNVVRGIAGDKFGQRPVTYITKLLRQMTFRGMLGLNPGSALRNISQGINTYAVLGEKYTTLGYASLLKKGSMQELADEGVLNAGFIQDKILSSTGKAMEKIDKGLFFFFDTAEKINRGAAYFGAKAKGISLGYDEAKAIEYAKFVVRKTQFVFDSVDTPVGMQSDIMKTLFQFQTFTTKQIEFLGEQLKDKNFVGLIRYAVAGMVFVYTIGKAFGMEPKELLPIYRFDTPPSLKLPTEVVKAVADSPDKYGNDRDLGQKASDIGKSAIGLIPAGTQAKKTIEGTQAMLQGKSKTKAGVAQFDVGGTLAKDAQAVLFGKYAGQNAKDYFAGDTYAEQKYEELLKSPTAKDDFEKIKNEDPNLARNILKVKEKIDLGITPKDENLLKLNNQPRAEAIVKELNKLKTKEEKAKLWEVYVTKKIITKDVADKLTELFKKEKPMSMLQKGVNTLLGVKTASAATPKGILPKVTTTETSEGIPVAKVPDQWQKYIDSAYKAHPNLNKYKGLIEAILMQESSMGQIDTKYDQSLGESAWLGGITQIAKDELDRNKIPYNVDTQKGVIDAIASYIDLKHKVTNPGSNKTIVYKDPVNLYLQRYKTKEGAKLSPEDIKKFRSYLNFYSK